jgi:hypothetical protein
MGVGKVRVKAGVQGPFAPGRNPVHNVSMANNNGAILHAGWGAVFVAILAAFPQAGCDCFSFSCPCCMFGCDPCSAEEEGERRCGPGGDTIEACVRSDSDCFEWETHGTCYDFIPDDDGPQGYLWTSMDDVTSLPFEPGTGERSTAVPLGAPDEETVVEVEPGIMLGVPVFDEVFEKFTVSSHGTLRFEGTDGVSWVEAFHAPFRSSETSAVIIDENADAMAVSFIGLLIGEAPCRTSSFQVVLRENGRIAIHHLMFDPAAAGQVGLWRGAGDSPGLPETDFCR